MSRFINLIAYILLIFAFSCSSSDKKPCKVEPFVKIASQGVSSKYECNQDKVHDIFMAGVYRFGLCEENMHIAGINAGGAACMIIPSIIRASEGVGQAYFECKKPFDLEKSIREIMGCQ